MKADVDLLVIGGNPGGCSAAITAARSGASVVLLEHTKTLGGMNANGTFGFDCATPQALSSIAEEIADRIRAHYARTGLSDPLFTKRADLVWESHVGAKVWHDLVAETQGITLHTRAVPVAVKMHGRRISEVHWQHASDLMGNLDPNDRRIEIVRPRIVIDASYEGDVAAWAGAPFRLGREARSPLEPHAGKIFTNSTEPGNDGTLPNTILPGSTGEGDDAIMAFVCRLHCRRYEDRSPNAPHRLKVPPAGYDPSIFAWGPLAHRSDGTPIYFNQLSVLVNGKFLLNRMSRGNNLVGPNRDYILAHPRERKALRQRFIDRSLGYLYFVQSDGGMPELGLAHDEFQDNGGLPYQIYVREGRRFEGQATLTEADVNPYIKGDGLRPPRKQDAVAIGDYTFESQGCADAAPPGYKYPDGYITNRATRAPFQIPYGCLLPQQVDNLLVSGAISASHLAWGAVRVEAVRIHLGIATGVAAILALRDRAAPHDISVDALQSELIERRVKLTYFADVESDHPDFAAIQWAALRSFIPESPAWRFEPAAPIPWAELLRATVVCLGLPISVSGYHFENIPRGHEAFRFAESVYDLGTRAGIDIFGAKRLADEDPMQEFLRVHPGFKLLALDPRDTPTVVAAARFLSDVSAAMGRDSGDTHSSGFVREPDSGPLTRSRMCALLMSVWKLHHASFAVASDNEPNSHV